MNEDRELVKAGKRGWWYRKTTLLFGVILLLLVVIIWQQYQYLGHSPANLPPGEQVSEPPVLRPGGQQGQPGGETESAPGVPDRSRLLRQRAQEVKALEPKETGERMFEELKTVVEDDPQKLDELLGILTREGRLRRQLVDKAAAGEITQQKLASALEHLQLESEAQAERLLTLRQFDRYREVRQSWKRGRAHPDRDSQD